MYFVYQIGDVPLYDALVGQSGDSVEVEAGYNWRTPSTAFQRSSAIQYHLPATRSLAEAVEFEVKGWLQATPYMNVTRIKNRLRSFGGRRNVPLILFQYEESHDVNCLPQLLWLAGSGIITEKVNNSRWRGEKDLGTLVTQEMELTITLSEPLRQLLPWFWEYRHLQEREPNVFSAEATYAGPNGEFWHPLYFRDLQVDHYFIQWQLDETLIDPQFWGSKYQGQVTGGQGSDFVLAPQTVFYFSDPDLWTHPPRALYAFTDCDPYGSLTIQVKLKSGPWQGDEILTTATLDLEQLNQELIDASYGGLRTADRIYTGDFAPRPGFIWREGLVLDGVRPRWMYSELYPGEVPNGATELIFSTDLTDALVAYCLDYGTV